MTVLTKQPWTIKRHYETKGKKYIYKIWENSKACLQMRLMIDRLLGASFFTQNK